MLCQVFPGCVPSTPPCGAYSAFQQTQAPLIATKRACGGIPCPWDGYLESCAPPINIWPPLTAPSFPSTSWVLYTVSPLTFSKAEALGEVVGTSSLSQGPITAVRIVLVGCRGEGRGGRARSDLNKRALRRSLKRGMKGHPQLPDLTHMSPSCRVSHGIAGTLLGEMALCAKKRPPGKTGGGGVSGTIKNGCYGSGIKGSVSEGG